MVPTSIKTENYAAEGTDYVPVDASEASVVITLPADPSSNPYIGVKLINVAGGHTATIEASGSDVFNKSGGSTSLTLFVLNQGVILQYSTSQHIWYVQADDLPISGLAGLFDTLGAANAAQSNAEAFATTAVSVETARAAGAEALLATIAFTTTAVGTEASARSAADTRLQGQISAIVASEGVPNGIATLGSSGQIPNAQLPALAITDTYVVNTQSAMLALGAHEGDVAIRTDINETFILSASPASTLSNWQQILTPTSTVSSIFGRTGAVTAESGDYTASQVGALALSGGTLTGALTVQGSFGVSSTTGADTTVSVQNNSSGKGMYLDLIANGGTNPFLSLSGFSGSGSSLNLLWRLGNVSTAGLTLYTNSAGGSGYAVAPALYIDYNQNVTIYENLTVEGSLNFASSIVPSNALNNAAGIIQNLGSSAFYWQQAFINALYLNSGAQLSGINPGAMTVFGLLRIPSGAITGYVLTSDSAGNCYWEPAATPAPATTATEGTVRLTGDLNGAANYPIVQSAHIAKGGFYMTDANNSQWLVTIDTDGSLMTTAVVTESHGSWTGIGILTYV